MFDLDLQTKIENAIENHRQDVAKKETVSNEIIFNVGN